MLTPADAVRNYILAKDGNRPFLMRQAFAESADLEIVVKTDAISFPSKAKGVDELTKALIPRFALDYQNVYTFCLTRPPATASRSLACHWLVGMSARSDGQVRVGCGRYDWHFGSEALAEKLVIVIDVMKVLPAEEHGACMNWLSALPYPWCDADEALQRMPALEGLADIKSYLQQARPPVPAQ